MGSSQLLGYVQVDDEHLVADAPDEHQILEDVLQIAKNEDDGVNNDNDNNATIKSPDSKKNHPIDS